MAITNGQIGLINQFIGAAIGPGDAGLRDYQHAARTFVDGLYRLGPKLNNLFHVFIELNPAVVQVDPINPLATYEIGLLAKTAQLPKFTINNKIYNAYNRKNVVQQSIAYDPIQMTFHDDSSDVIRNFWYGYYSYYYRDSDHSAALYNQEYKYRPRQTQNWGFSPKYKGPDTPNYINAIRIYSLHQKSFSSYILFRPTIQSFQHDEHTQGEYQPMQHTMQFAYEAVQYEYGTVDAGNVTGFDILHYDNIPSPLINTKAGPSILIDGLVEGVLGGVHNLNQGAYASSSTSAVRAFTTFKNSNLNTTPVTSLGQTAAAILRGQNTQSPVFFPTSSSVQDGISKATPGLPSSGSGPINGISNINTQNDLTAQQQAQNLLQPGTNVI